MKKLWMFKHVIPDGSVEGVFVATDQELEDAYGRVLSFEKVLGRGVVEDKIFYPEDVIELSSREEFIEFFESKQGDSFGCNPLNYIEHEGEMN